MSNIESYYPFDEESQKFSFPITCDHDHDHDHNNNHQIYNIPFDLQNPNEFDHSSSPNMSFSNLSCSPISDHVDVCNYINNSSTRDEVVHNYLPSSSSCSSPGEEGSSSKGKQDLQIKACEGGEYGKSSKKEEAKKKEEKKERQVRFAFMTKSEIDHLEDGYRWRKYGQKAVKNSPFPRSYYRCTSQKCGVKKRIERSHENPTVVITAYEGQHNHHSPANLRSSTAVMLPPSLFSPAPALAFSGFSQNQLLFPSTTHQNNPANHFTQLVNLDPHQEQPDQFIDQYGLFLPDMFSSYEPPP